MKRRILLVDDDLAVLLTLKAVLEFHGFEVETASSTAEAISRLESAEYAMVISDLRMETEDAMNRIFPHSGLRDAQGRGMECLFNGFPGQAVDMRGLRRGLRFYGR